MNHVMLYSKCKKIRQPLGLNLGSQDHNLLEKLLRDPSADAQFAL